MAKPKLALIPAAQGDKFYSVLPSDGVGDFDFTRASTGTRIAPTGLIEEVASGDSRLNYDLLNGKVVNCPHYLLEPQRTNLETKSNGFSTWAVNSNITKTANYILSPDGTLNGTRLQFTANGFTANTPQSLATYTISCYAKRNDSGTQNVGFFTNGSGVVNSAWEITSEWKRFSYTFPALNGSYMGIAGLIGADISVFGLQIEGLVSYPTSYIPTNGSTVTRSAETANGSGDAATFNDSEGVLMAEIAALANDGTNRFISLTNGVTDATNISLAFTTTTNQIRILVDISYVLQMSLTYTVNSVLDFNKIILKYKENDFALWVNGFEVATDPSGTVPTANYISDLSFQRISSLQFYGKTRELQYFNSVLTDAQLETLTSWTSLQEMITSQLYTNY